jgi:phosphonate transport system substrate-binding protein
MKRICAVLRASLVLAMVLAIHQPASAVEQPASAAAEYTISAVPQFEQRKLYATWKPIVDELARRTGLRLKLVTTLTIQDFHKAYGRGEFDFAYVNPYNIVYFRRTQGYIPLAADGVPLRGIVVVAKDSAIKTVADLDGKTVAFPSPNALGASLLVRADLEQIHHVRITPLYVSTHSSVYIHVAKGLTAAGGGVEKTLQEQDNAIQAQLQVIYTTRPCPSHPVAAHPRVPPEVREQVRAALLAMGETKEGKEMLARVPIMRIIPVTYDDYAELSGWGLDKYWQAAPEQN